MTQTNYFEAADITVNFVKYYKHKGRTYYSVAYYRKGFGGNVKSVSKKTALEVAKNFRVSIYL